MSMFAHVVKFSRVLHHAGVEVNSSNLIDLCRSFAHIDIRSRRDFYEAAKCTLISSRDSLDVFQLAFHQYWDGLELPLPDKEVPGDEADDEQTGQPQRPLRKREAEAAETQDGQTGEPSDTESDPEQVGYSDRELLVKKDFAAMSEEEMEQARKLVAELIAVLFNRRNRRFEPAKKAGNLDFRRMYRHSMPYGEYCTKLYYRNHPLKKTRLLMICDVSGSMERYSRFLIQLISVMADKLADLEVALFSTRMTHFTPYLQANNVQELITQISAQVHDWAGGTNIGGSLREFNRFYADKMLHSNSVAVILSDGWDRGDAKVMRTELEVLKRRVQSLIWLNPLMGKKDYEPLCRGIRTALPFLDHFLPVHNLESLAEVIRTLQAIRHQR
jgi:uncharacterized protein with von Willebrand factor type A (vWA) domain